MKPRPGWFDLHLQIRLEMRDAVKAAAAAEDRTLTSWVRRAITEKLKRDSGG